MRKASWKTHKQRKQWEENQKVYKKFSELWKTDDKEWMKQRRKDWKSIQIQLDRMRDNNHFGFNSLKKKDYKYFKSYFLTGRDTPETPLEKMQRCLFAYSPINGSSYTLLQFWLCPDHSVETLEYIKNNTYLRSDESYESNNSLFYDSCITYRRTSSCYGGNYKWTEEGGTTEINGPIFGELEPKMLELFAFSTESVKSFQDENYRGKKALYSYFETTLLGFLGDFKPNIGVTVGYNPHNPILNLIDEYMRWGFPKEHEEPFSKGGKTRVHIIAYALIMYVVDTPDSRPKKQLEFAKELKQRITVGLPDMSEDANTRWDTAAQFYKDGGLKSDLVDYKL